MKCNKCGAEINSDSKIFAIVVDGKFKNGYGYKRPEGAFKQAEWYMGFNRYTEAKILEIDLVHPGNTGYIKTLTRESVKKENDD